ncbi:MAG TPA: ABC transporter permease [Streptosporangiaceae bacterium]|nr:ABC transporter permease [Streptosporangiaceae bacterium]
MNTRTFAFFTWAVVRETLRDRVAAFFVLLLPFAIIGLVGTVLSAGAAHPLGIVSNDHGPLGKRLITDLSRDQDIHVTHYATLAALKTAVREQRVSAGLYIPAGFDAALDGRGTTAPEFVVEREELVPSELRLAVYGDVTAVTTLGVTARYDAQLGHLSMSLATRRAASFVAGGMPRTRIDQVTQPAATALTGVAYSAPGNLVLFLFLNIVGSGSGLVVIRQSGVPRRMLSTATGPWTIALSEGAGRVALGLLQALVIIVVGAFAFHVRWGPLPGVFAVVFLASAISAALALIMSAISATPQQAFVLGPATMLVAAMLGGCLWPLVFVGAPLRAIGRIFPLYWAMDALLRLGARSGTREVAVDTGVLLGFAIVLTLIAVPVYRRRIAVG